MNSIENEPEFKRFLLELEATAKAETLTVEEQLNVILNKKAGTSFTETPLTQFIMRKSLQRHDRRMDEKKAREEERKTKLQRLMEKQRTEKQAKIVRRTEEPKPSKPKDATARLQAKETMRPPRQEKNDDKGSRAAVFVTGGESGSSKPRDVPHPRGSKTQFDVQKEKEGPAAQAGEKKKRPERAIYRPGKKKELLKDP